MNFFKILNHIFLALFFIIFSLNAYAINFNSYKDEINNFKINYPENWIKEENQDKYNILFHNKIESAFLGIKIQTVDDNTNILSFINELEKNLTGFKRKKQKFFNKKELENLGFGSGISRDYQTDGLNMNLYIFSIKNKFFILTEISNKTTIAKNDLDLLKKITYSFRINKNIIQEKNSK
ncbi:MAG: PsbP-related protein [Candidatus Sericytochromatia bacterium]